MLIELFLDREFRNYNFCEIPNRGSPSEDQLFDLVDKARNGDRSAFLEFGDIMYWTLREPAYECYQADCGPQPISHGDYFYAKLQVFLDVLVYEKTYHSRDWDPAGGQWEGRTALRSSGPEIYPRDVQELLVPADSERLNWVDLVQVVSMEKHDRLAALRGWLRKQAQPTASTVLRRRAWGKNAERDRIILNCLRRGVGRHQICIELDRRTIATLTSLQDKAIFKWIEAWADPNGQQAIQRLFSKVHAREKLVKTQPVSK